MPWVKVNPPDGARGTPRVRPVDVSGTRPTANLVQRDETAAHEALPVLRRVIMIGMRDENGLPGHVDDLLRARDER